MVVGWAPRPVTNLDRRLNSIVTRSVVRRENPGPAREQTSRGKLESAARSTADRMTADKGDRWRQRGRCVDDRSFGAADIRYHR